MTRFIYMRERASSCQIKFWYTNKYKLHIFYYQTSCIIIPIFYENHEFLENFTHFIFNPRRCDKRTLGIEHFYKGHDGDFIHIKNIFFDQQKVK